MRRLRRLGWAGLLSLALHAVVLLLLWKAGPAPSLRASRGRERAIEVEILTPPPVSVAKPTPPDSNTSPARPQAQEPLSPPTPHPRPPAGTATREPPARRPASPPPEVANREPPPSGVPSTEAPPPDIAVQAPSLESDRPAADVPRAQGTLPLNLLPPPGSSGGVIITTPENSRGGGRTLRPGDPSLAPEALAAEEKARVSERVQGIIDDRRARDRVDTGRIHPYFSKLRAKLERQMHAAPLFDMPSLPKQLLHSWADKAHRFGASGSPGAGPPTRAPPKPGELLAQRARNNPEFDRLRGQSQAGEELQSFANGVSTLKLVVTLELIQGPDGTLREVKLVSRSGNRAYDDYVLQSVPSALAKTPPPPPDALGVNADGIRTLWAVEGRVVYVRKVSEMKGSDSAYLAAAAAVGVLAGGFEETTGEVYVIDVRNPHFECRSRLLRVY